MSITLLLALTMATQAQITRTAPAAPVVTAAPTDARFAHWLGCWRLEDDLVGTGARVCIIPDEKSGVTLQTLIGTQRGPDESIVADGVARPIADADCKGNERAEWSGDGLRVYRYMDVTCGKDPVRKVSSVAFLAKGPSWVNVQLVEGGPTRNVRVQRYRRALDQTLADGSKAPLPSARMRAGAPAPDFSGWTVGDVIEASAKLPADAVQAAITEDRGPYDVNKKNLLAMNEAGVSESVIDLMIALTYPKRFVVQRAGGGSYAPSGISTGGGWYDPFMSPMSYSSMMFDCYGMGYRSYYSSCGSYYTPYAYGYNGYNGYNGYYGGSYPGYGGGGGWVVVDSTPGTAVATATEGRVVNGRGYTQVRPRDAEPSPIRSGNVSNGAAHDNGGSSSSGNGGSGVSSQGYSNGSGSSSGSGSDSGARTAVPRPPGQ